MKMYGLGVGVAVVLSLSGSVGQAQQYFHGYLCTPDCSRHEVGYEWAQQHSITDPREYDGITQGFIEGCQAYAGEEGPYGSRDQSVPDAGVGSPVSVDSNNPDSAPNLPDDDASPE